MLDKFRRGQRWLTAIFIGVIGGVFVFFMGQGGGAGGGRSGAVADAVVQIDEIHYGQRDFQRVKANNLRQLQDSIGEGLDSKTAESFAAQQALRALLESAILAHSARELGLAVGKPEVQQVLRDDPSLRDADGRFDQKNFEDMVEYNFGSQRLFLEAMRLDLLRQKMVQVLVQLAYVSDGEVRTMLKQQLERVKLVAVSLDTHKLPADEVLTETEVEAFANASDEQLRSLYAERQADFSSPAKVRVRHLVLRLEADADESEVEAARSEIESARERILAGESFADLAREISQDEDSRDSGGDLGWIARGEATPTIEEVAFGLEAGAISPPTRSPTGIHLIQLEERREAGVRSFEEVRLELARSQAERERAGERANRLADELAAELKAGSSLESAARERGLTLLRTGQIGRRIDGLIPGIGTSQDLMAAIFARAEDASRAQRVFSVGNRLVLFEILERDTPSEEEIAEALPSARDKLLASRREDRVRAWIGRQEQKLNEEGRLLVNSALITGG